LTAIPWTELVPLILLNAFVDSVIGIVVIVVASLRAASKSKNLLVNVLQGKTPEDQEILDKIRGHMLRPELVEVTNAITAKMDQVEFPEPDMEAIGREVATHVEMALKNMEAQQVNRLQKHLDDLGLDDVMGEQKAAIMAQIPDSMKQMQKLANYKVSKRYQEEHPLEALVIEVGKTGLMQYFEANGVGLAGVLGGVVQGQSQQRGSGFNPGAVR